MMTTLQIHLLTLRNLAYLGFASSLWVQDWRLGMLQYCKLSLETKGF